MEREEFLAYMKELRDIENCCPTCNGMGVRGYGDTSTWHGGIGGQMITSDICDKCWGSGDLAKRGVNLRVLNSILTQEQRNTYRKLTEE